jgi:hypothetical protein
MAVRTSPSLVRAVPQSPVRAAPQIGVGTAPSASLTNAVLAAIQARVDQSGSRVVFDSIDVNSTGRVSADELRKALRSWTSLVVSEEQLEEVMKDVNGRYGSKRKALTYDVFVQVFKSTGRARSRSPPRSPQVGAPPRAREGSPSVGPSATAKSAGPGATAKTPLHSEELLLLQALDA